MRSPTSISPNTPGTPGGPGNNPAKTSVPASVSPVVPSPAPASAVGGGAPVVSLSPDSPQPKAGQSAVAPEPAKKAWSSKDSSNLYGIDRWGQKYFSINEEGNVVAHPTKEPHKAIDMKKLVDELKQRDLQLPLLIRFTDILKDRVVQVHTAFSNAIKEHDYKGNYRCVYPIKVNQQRHVVEEILHFGKPYNFGLEAGSKPELLAVLAMVEDDKTPIICNGFKDDEFIEAVILATKIGKNIIPVVEKFSELELIAKYAKLHNVKPSIGVRVKLSARGAGRWEESGGARSKFGLFINEVVQALEFLRKNDLGDCLNLLHFHLGSQINNIRMVKSAIIELVRVYTELQRMGAGLQYIDVGGGLGVDYDGSKTSFESSINYSMQEYANDVVYHVKEICDQAGVAHPTIISESGRAMVAYHSVLVFNVLGWSGFNRFEIPATLSKEDRLNMPAPVVNMFDTYHGLNESNYAEYYHDAQLAKEEVLNLFNLGYCSLEQRSLAERLYYALSSKVNKIVRAMDFVPEEFSALESMLSDTYFCNYSVFQSMPDSWAIDQLFPIMPIHRLNEQPTSRGILADITCDSDGKVDRFIGTRCVKPVLELHDYKHEDYFLAVFLVGAYQEILGDLHNLLGDTNAVHVSVGPDGNASIDEVIEGDTVREVLQYVQFSAEDLMRQMRKAIERALREKKVTLDESRVLLKFYEQGLKGYTYLE